MAKSVYDQLCEMFGKDSVDYAIAEAKGNAPCICHIKNADKCSVHNNPKK